MAGDLLDTIPRREYEKTIIFYQRQGYKEAARIIDFYKSATTR
jgi:hypothetical protein